MTASRSSAAVWFGRVVWIGILANLALAIPTLIAPERMMAMVGVPIATPLLWVRFSALLLILLSAFYIPAALDPFRYPLASWLTIVGRAAGVIFFAPQPTYRMFGTFDLVFLVPEAILLTVAMRASTALPQMQGRAVS